MRVLFAPDYRAGVPYQTLLAGELSKCGVTVEFAKGYRRLLPLARTVLAEKPDILHLHWPEAYFSPRGDVADPLRVRRFRLDLALARSRTRVVTTAHNMFPHDRRDEPGVRANSRAAYRSSSAIFVHSEESARQLSKQWSIPSARFRHIAHGDLATDFGSLLPRHDAKRKAGVIGHRVAIMFGAVLPYKGIEEVLKWWDQTDPTMLLVIAGRAPDPDYARKLQERAAGVGRVSLVLRWLTNDELRVWLSAADIAVFNYEHSLTSGAACLARSLGIPIVIPRRLTTVFLDEPSGFVHRFAATPAEFTAALRLAAAVEPNFEAAKGWREASSWERVAATTYETYAQVLACAR